MAFDEPGVLSPRVFPRPIDRSRYGMGTKRILCLSGDDLVDQFDRPSLLDAKCAGVQRAYSNRRTGLCPAQADRYAILDLVPASGMVFPQ